VWRADDEERRYLRDVEDHALRRTRPDHQVFASCCRNILSVNLTLEDQDTERDEHRPERGGQEDLRVGGDPVRSLGRRNDLRHGTFKHMAPSSNGSWAIPMALGLMARRQHRAFRGVQSDAHWI